MLSWDDVHAASRIHTEGCTRAVGPRGGFKERVVELRFYSGARMSRAPGGWTATYKYGLRQFVHIGPHNAGNYHAERDCPLNAPVAAPCGCTFGRYGVVQTLCDEAADLAQNAPEARYRAHLDQGRRGVAREHATR